MPPTVRTRAYLQSIYPGRVINEETDLDWSDFAQSALLDEDISANGRSLIAAANYAAMRALLDLEAGTDFLSPAAIAAAYQPLDGDLTAIAALTTAAYGRSLLETANAGAARTLLGLGTAALAATGDFDAAGAAAAAQAASQPLDGDLTAIAALTTAAFGRSLLEAATAAAARTLIGAGTGSGDFLASGAVPMTGDITLKTATVFTDYANGKAVIAGTTPMLALGGTSSSYPAWKRSGAVMQARLADDSAFADIQGAQAKFDVDGAGVVFTTFHSGGCNISNTGYEQRHYIDSRWHLMGAGCYLEWGNAANLNVITAADAGLERRASEVVGTCQGYGNSQFCALSYGSWVQAKTGNYTVTIADGASVFTNEGAGAEVIFTLPTALKGLRYTFIVQAAQNLRITAGTGDTIRVAGVVSAAAGNMVNAVVGSSVTLVAINATEWMAESAINGTWTVT